MQRLGIALVGLGQAIPFFHAGVDMLRSKSLDRDSYNSGDWFNRLDFGYEDNNWGRGLPPANRNEEHWPVMAPLLATAPAPDAPAIGVTVRWMRDVLRIRRGSALFRLETAEQVQAHLRFHNTGPEQTPGLIVMSLEDAEGSVDPLHRRVVVLFNALGTARQFVSSDFTGAGLVLHPTLRESADPRVGASRFDPARGRFSIEARTTAVFVEPHTD
jgi:pullulanase/glycogen debranching enzyme